jgi:HD-GYP domain-containing protein (c-di-GMP phosphodiesterase class II)
MGASGVQSSQLDCNAHRPELNIFEMFPFISYLEQKNPHVAGHSVKVAAYSAQLALKLGLPREEAQRIYFGSILHDVGKIGIPDSILSKPGPLTAQEFHLITQHPERGAKYIAEWPSLAVYLDIVRHHHERIDGRGYPDGICGDELSLAVRIVTICDAFDAMTSHRVYREAMSQQAAVAELRQGAGTQFDARLVQLFERCLEETPYHDIRLAAADVC